MCNSVELMLEYYLDIFKMTLTFAVCCKRELSLRGRNRRYFSSLPSASVAHSTMGSMDQWAAHSLLLQLGVRLLTLAFCPVYLQYPHLRFAFFLRSLSLQIVGMSHVNSV